MRTVAFGLLLILAACHRCPLGLECEATLCSLDADTQARLGRWVSSRLEAAPVQACPNGMWPQFRAGLPCVEPLVGPGPDTTTTVRALERAVEAFVAAPPCGPR